MTSLETYLILNAITKLLHALERVILAARQP